MNGEHASDSAGPQDGDHVLAGIKVLLVDDCVDALEGVSLILGMSGASVTGASSAAQALEHALLQRFDILVSDIGMPQMDGLELVRRMKSTQSWCGAPAIALTGFGRQADVDEALSAGYDAHLDKPVDIAKLIGLIHGFCHREGGGLNSPPDAATTRR